MSKLIKLDVPSNINELLIKGETTPDFKIHTAAADADPTLPLVHMIGSSTEKDLQGDTMTVNALADMCKIAPMLSVFMNHEYDLPDKLFGSIIEPPILQQQNGVADLHLTVGVEETNPKAMQTLGYIRNGRRLGCSVGCMVTSYEVADEEDGDNWFYYPIIIHGVYVVEFSVVGIPANQRSWVDNAIKGAFARTLDPALAPAMKSLWGSDFRKIVKGVPDASLRKQLEDAPERPGGDKRISWIPETKTFVFNANGKTKTLESTEVADYVNKHQYPHIPPAPVVKTAEPESAEELEQKAESAEELEQKAESAEELELEIKADGSHGAFTGTHSHAHSAFGDQGDDDAHEHTHTHDDDAKHNHSHAEKSAEPEAEKAAAGCGCCDACTGKKDCTCCDACKSAEPEAEKSAELDAAQTLILSHYNATGKMLGLPELSAEHVTKGVHPVITKDVDMQSVVTCVSAIDELSDALEGKVDTLMVMLGIPDYDLNEDYDTGEEASAASTWTYSLAGRFLKRGIELLSKEGREFSTENMQTLQTIHDAINSMTEGKVCGVRGNANTGAQSGEESLEDAASDANAASGGKELTESFEGFSKSVQVLTESTEQVTAVLKALEQLKDVQGLISEVSRVSTVFAHIKRDTQKTLEEAQNATEVVRKLKAMPLGRPNTQVRSVEPTAIANTVTYTQLADIEGGIQKSMNTPQTEEEAIALTRVVKETLRSGQELAFREWPREARTRPHLTALQRTLMSAMDMVNYNSGEVARVPLSPNELERQLA